MGKFSAAKMAGAQDVKMQNAFNQLIDLLETGYVSESMLGGHKVRISVDPRGGLQILSDDVQIGGIIFIEGIPTMVAGAITNDATDPQCWVKIGETVIDGTTYKGQLFFFKNYSSSDPIFSVTVSDQFATINQVDGGKIQFDRVNKGITYSYYSPSGSGSGSFAISHSVIGDSGFIMLSTYNNAGVNKGTVAIGQDQIQINAAGTQFLMNATKVEMLRDTNNSIGLDSGGPYYRKAGTKTYF